MNYMSLPVLKSSGYCVTCDREADFISKHTWLRDHFVCTNCGSLPRERALMLTIERIFPNWRNLTIHESSPVNRGASVRLARECHNYIPSHYYKDQKQGIFVGKFLCQSLEELIFPDESIDLHITQDVLEHVFHPIKAFKELARTLKPGGAHIFTVPIVNKFKPSKLRAEKKPDGEILHHDSPVYHGNPLSNDGSLVTVDWGFDICEHIFKSTGLYTQIIHIDDLGVNPSDCTPKS